MISTRWTLRSCIVINATIFRLSQKALGCVKGKMQNTR